MSALQTGWRELAEMHVGNQNCTRSCLVPLPYSNIRVANLAKECSSMSGRLTTRTQERLNVDEPSGGSKNKNAPVNMQC